MQSTEWRPVVGFESLYEVSDSGLVRSIKRTVIRSDGSRRTVPERILKVRRRGSKKYQTVALYAGGRRSDVSVHRVVASAFLRLPEGRLEVCHNDGDVDHNHVSNLRWGTHSENMLDKAVHGTDLRSFSTHCKHGHEYTEKNTRIVKRDGSRQCRTCARATQARLASRAAHV